jgi:hypothetical protein
VLSDASRALLAAASYRVAGMLDPDFVVDVAVRPEGVDGAVTSHGLTWRVRTLGDYVWFSGAALWRATLPRRAGELGEGWVRVDDPDAGFRLAGRLARLPQSIPGIVFAPHPGLRSAGVKTLDGRRVVELRTDKDVYDVLADGTPYPVRWLELGETDEEGRPCGITLSGFNALPSPAPAPSTELVVRASPSP